jgi:hypothetical protein
MSDGPDLLMTEERLASLERFKTDMEKRFADAFPGGDHVGHCRYHTTQIEILAERRRLRQAILEKSIGGLVWAVIVFVGVSALAYIKNYIRGG